MPTYDTPAPISVSVELGVGDLRVDAADRTDTVVEVRPSDPSRAGDVAAAEQTRVDFSNGRLTIRVPRHWVQTTFRNRGDSVDVSVGLPAGSDVRADAGVAAIRCTGPAGDVRLQAGVGDIAVDQAAQLRLRSGAGDVSVGSVYGQAEVTSGAGLLSVESVDGDAVIKNTSGDIWIGAAGGDLRVNAANGSITVGRPRAAVTAKTARGDISLGEITSGTISVQTALGRIDLGIGDGVAAWLDLHTNFGHVRSNLPAAEPPVPGAEAVEIRARTSYGDISVSRAARATRSGQ